MHFPLDFRQEMLALENQVHVGPWPTQSKVHHSDAPQMHIGHPANKLQPWAVVCTVTKVLFFLNEFCFLLLPSHILLPCCTANLFDTLLFVAYVRAFKQMSYTVFHTDYCSWVPLRVLALMKRYHMQSFNFCSPVTNCLIFTDSDLWKLNTVQTSMQYKVESGIHYLMQDWYPVSEVR